MIHKPKSKEKLLAEKRAKELRDKLIREGKLSEEFSNIELNIIQSTLLSKGNMDGKRVRINMADYDFRRAKGKLSKKFCDWLDENKDNEFIARLYNNDTKLLKYELDGVENWIFTVFDLDPIE